MDKISLLKNPIQEYHWGSRTFIPQLIGETAPTHKPKAEVWMGAHPKAPSQVLCDGEWITLSESIQRNPEAILGKSVAKKFLNRLPFLFKVLAADKPLSLQVHPNHDQALEGFTRENRLGVPLNAPHRNYRDQNHKPEMICALKPFWALNGFRKIEDLIALVNIMEATLLKDRLSILIKQPDREGFKDFFTILMTTDRDFQMRMVREVVDRSEKYSGPDPAFEWVVKLNQEYPDDIGVLSPILMQLIRLRPGEAMFTPPGSVHAYLDGAGIELMANSDNVLRGGLTAKNIDVPGLLKVLDFTYRDVTILKPNRQESGENIYPAVAEEFMLSLIPVRKDSVFDSPLKRNVEIMICTEGEARVTDLGSGSAQSLSKGTAIVVPAAVKRYRIEGDSTLYKAAVPT